MNQKLSKVNPDPKGLTTITKRGICIYILEGHMISSFVRELLRFFEKGVFIFKKKVSEERAGELVTEVASYFYCETVRVIFSILPKNDAGKLSDVISYYWRSWELNSPHQKLVEYYRTNNPTGQVARNIQKIVKGEDHKDVKEQFLIEARFASLVANPEYSLFDSIREVFTFSDAEMSEIIEEFFTTVNSPAIKKLYYQMPKTLR